MVFAFQPVPADVTVLTDSDWAGCKKTRRSTSGVVVVFGSHVLSFACRMQKCIALSSGEVELNAQVLGATEGLGVRNVLEELGFATGLESWCDSSAARWGAEPTRRWKGAPPRAQTLVGPRPYRKWATRREVGPTESKPRGPANAHHVIWGVCASPGATTSDV